MPNGDMTHDVYALDLVLNDEQAQKAVRRTSNVFSRMFQAVGRQIERMTKQKVAKSYTQWVKGLDSTINQYAALQKEIEEVGGAIQSLQAKSAGAHGDEKKAIQDQIDGHQKMLDVLKKEQDLVRHGKKDVGGKTVVVDAKAASQVYRDEMPDIFKEAAGKAAEQLRQTKIDALTAFAKYDFKAAGSDVGDGFKDVLGSLGGRDLAGMGKGLAKAMGASLKGIGAGLTRYGMKKREDPTAGLMGKAMGKMAGGMGELVGFIAKLGPMLSMVGGIMAAIVKLFIDAEAAAKEFNKEVLASASTTELLGNNGMDAEAAMADLADTLSQIRNTAMGFGSLMENMKWGIGKKQFTEVLGALTAEGVSIRQIQKDAEAAKQSVGDFSAEMVKVAVTYSRNFGVSLNEVATFSGQMMSDLGMSLETVDQSFRMIGRAASESGIASNKFFAIIRNVSADMSLFNLRMEDAVTTLKLLGKAMSPKNAEKFMQAITQHYKNMGLTERIGAVLKAGGAGKVGGILKTELKTRITGMAGDIASKIGNKEAAAELQKAMARGPKETARFMAKYQDKISGADRDAITAAMRQQTKLQRGGLVDVASGLKDTGPMGTMLMFESIAQNMLKKPIEQLADVELLAFTNLASVSDEQVDQMIQARGAITQTKEDLAYKIESGGKLTDEQTKMLEALNLQGTAQEKAAKVRAMKDSQVFATMTELQRKEAMGIATEKDYAKAQTQAIDTVGDKLERIIDALLTEVYNALMGIWESVNIFGDSPELTEAKARNEIFKSGNAKLIEEFKKSGKKGTEFLAEQNAKKQQAAREEATSGQYSAMAYKGDRDYQAAKSAVDEAQQVLGSAEDELALAIQDGVEDLTFYQQAVDDAKDALEATKEDFSRQAARSAEQARMDPDVWRESEAAQQRLTEAQNEQYDAEMAYLEIQAQQQAAWQDLQDAMSQGFEGADLAPFEDALETANEELASATDRKAAAESEVETWTPPGAAPVDASKSKEALEAAAKTATATERSATAGEDLLDEGTKGSTLYFKFPDSFLSGAYAKTIKDSVLEALRIALFEFWMYQEQDRGDAATWLKGGGDPKAFGQEYVRKVTEAGSEVSMATGEAKAPGLLDFLFGGGKKEEKGHQAGGLVTGINGGMAVVRPAPGEGLTSIGKGETILPANARGGVGAGGSVKVELSLKGDLARIIEAKASDVVYESKRRERFTG